MKPDEMGITDTERPETPTCCGVECETAFCPHCGNKLREPKLLRGLLKYLDARVKSANKRRNEALNEQFTNWHTLIKSILDAQTQVEAEAGGQK